MGTFVPINNALSCTMIISRMFRPSLYKCSVIMYHSRSTIHVYDNMIVFSAFANICPLLVNSDTANNGKWKNSLMTTIFDHMSTTLRSVYAMANPSVRKAISRRFTTSEVAADWQWLQYHGAGSGIPEPALTYYIRAYSSPSGSGQSPAAKCILVQFKAQNLLISSV